MGWLKPLFELLVTIAQYLVGRGKKREQEAKDPVNKTKDLQSEITADNEQALGDAIHDWRLRRQLDDPDQPRRL